MTARVHSPRHQQQEPTINPNNPTNLNNSNKNLIAENCNKLTAANSNSSSAAAVAAAVVRLHQQAQQQLQLHQQAAQLFAAVQEDSSTSPNPSPCTTPSPGPKLTDGRRANKPLMEKRRRARINQSLAALKALILDSARLENTKHSKLEKADILELTVRHLQRQRSLTQPGLSRYKAGYQDCSREVSRYLDAPDIITGNTTPIDPAFKQRLLRHLDSCVSELDLDLGSRPDSGLGSSPGSVTDRVLGSNSPVPLDHQHQHAVAAVAAAAAAAHCSAALGAALIKQEMPELQEATRPDSSTAPGDENNNSSRPTSAFGQIHPAAVAGMAAMEQAAGGSQTNPNMLSVVQVIPSRLPDGQVVFLLPSHYVQLAAAAAANGISIGPNPPTAIWAATNMSLLKATDKLIKRPLCDEPSVDWPDPITGACIKPSKSPRIEPPSEQPLDFTTSSAKKLKAAAARYMAQQQQEQQQQQQRQQQQQQQPQQIQPETATTTTLLNSSYLEEISPPSSHTSESSPIMHIKEEKIKEEIKPMVTGLEIEGNNNNNRTPVQSPGLQQVKDEEGMWRPW